MRLLQRFLILFLVRLFDALTIKTFFQPDEYFQALEPAHNLVFGYGYITWEWEEQLRSALHPLLYAGGYWLVRAAVPTEYEDFGVQLAPRVISALVAAIVDTYTYRFALRFTSDAKTARISWLFSLFSGWNWYVSARAFSNNLETAFTVVGLSFWPWHRFKLLAVLIACFFGFWSCLVRPTNSILWGFLGAHLLLKNYGHWRRILRLALLLSVVLAIVIGSSALIDRYYYKEWTFPAVNFLEFNVWRNLSVFYGSAPWHFYIFQGLPLMLMGFLPFFVISNFQSWNILCALTIYVTIAFSAIAHKEFRFLQPIYPAMLIICGIQASKLSTRKWFSGAMVVVVAVHACAAFFFTRINEKGEIDIIHFLRADRGVDLVGFLTPCHSTPWHSMLHSPQLAKTSWFLTCEPPLHLSHGNIENVKEYRDELDRFFDDPDGFLDQKLGNPIDHIDTWPSHIVVFEPMKEFLDTYLEGSRMHECAAIFNSYFHWDARRQGDIYVYCKEPPHAPH